MATKTLPPNHHSGNDIILDMLFQGETSVPYCPAIIEEIADTIGTTPEVIEHYLKIMLMLDMITYKSHHGRLSIIIRKQ